jgi:guanylate kinase
VRKGKLIVFSAPSGAGKSSLIAMAMRAIPTLRYSVSATTRTPRCGEVDGVHYYFLTREGFEAMISSGELAEWNEVHGNLYGTPRPFLDRTIAQGRARGARPGRLREAAIRPGLSGKRRHPDPPSFLRGTRASTARTRHRSRGGHPGAAAQRTRAELAAAEMGNFRHRLVNDDFDRSRKELLDILGMELEADRDRRRSYVWRPTRRIQCTATCWE